MDNQEEEVDKEINFVFDAAKLTKYGKVIPEAEGFRLQDKMEKVGFITLHLKNKKMSQYLKLTLTIGTVS